jgi:hypothetical protein
MSHVQRCAAIRPWLTLLALLAGPIADAAQPAIDESAVTEAPPLQCWWLTDRVAVHVGEQLQLTLTCAAAETATATVMPDWDQLQPDAVDLAPFEVVAGSRSEDVVTPPWRYAQFEYTLRLTGEEFFGLDVPLPPLEIVYSIAVGAAGGTVQQGRERTYVLPPLPMKVLSLVPGQADDIEDATAYSFAGIERRRSQAAMAFVVGCGLLAAGVLYVLLFLGSAFRSLRTRRAPIPFRVADWRIVAGCRSALRRVASAAGRSGWSDASVGEALTLLRVLGAVAIRTPVRQQIAMRGRAAETGEWLLHRLSLRRPRVALSAAVTAAQLRAHASQGPLAVSDQAIEDLAAALAACADVRYGRDAPDGTAIAAAGGAIQDALSASRELFLAALLPSRLQGLAARHAVSGAS